MWGILVVAVVRMYSGYLKDCVSGSMGRFRILSEVRIISVYLYFNAWMQTHTQLEQANRQRHAQGTTPCFDSSVKKAFLLRPLDRSPSIVATKATWQKERDKNRCPRIVWGMYEPRESP